MFCLYNAISRYDFPSSQMELSKTLPLHSPSRGPKFLNPTLSISLKPPLIINPNKLCNLPTFPFCLNKDRFSSRFALSPIYHIPTSKISPTNINLAMFLAKKVLICLIGVFFFMGSLGLNPRPSLALPAQARIFGENSEQKTDAQLEKGEVEEMYEKILENEPRNLEALKAVVQGKMRRGQMKEAVKYVERLIDIEQEEVEWRLLEALCYEMMGQLKKAKRLFDEILKDRPLLLRALHGMVMVMHKNQEGPAVFGMLYKALDVAHREKRVTEDRSIRILISQMHLVKGELEDGLKMFQELIEENPRDFRPYLCQGIIYSMLDRKKEAAEYFDTYQSLVPEEFPQRRFLDDMVLAAKMKSQEVLQKEFEAEFSQRK